MAGKTTLLTTVLICVEAVCQVLSTAPATSPVPAANAVVAIIPTMSSDRMKQAISLLGLRFIKIPPFFFARKAVNRIEKQGRDACSRPCFALL